MKIVLFFIFALVHLNELWAQNTVGLLSYDSPSSYDGLNMIYPHNQPNVYLINNCGEVVHIWTDEANSRPGNTAYLRPDGTLVKTKRPSSFMQDAIWAPGGGASVEIRDWDNNLEWSFTLNDSSSRLHHDIEPMPNGNILMIVWERKSRQQAIAAGRDSTTLTMGELWPDYLIEVDPTNDSIVWEWHAWDHLVQDFDSSQANFSIVSDHPELININFDTDDNPDWLHMNAIDYNAALDQIMVCVPFLNEFWIIDHSTSREEAAQSFGGLSGSGGDLLYRWGNPQSYGGGVPEDQLLFNPHDAHWIDDFLDFTHPDFGKIIVFNNQAGPDFSYVNIITPPWDMYSWAYTIDQQAWGPINYDATIAHPVQTRLHSTGLSSAQVLPNGNYLICSGRQGYSFELTPTNEIVWEYVTPLRGGIPVNQGDSLALNNNLTFRNQRYPMDFEAFSNRTFMENTWLENNPDSTFCDLISPVDEEQYVMLNLYPNPASKMTVLEWRADLHTSIEIVNLVGSQMFEMKASGGRKYLDITSWPNGLYFVRIAGKVIRKLVVEN